MHPWRSVLDLAVPRRCPACDRSAVTAWCGSCTGAAEQLVLPDLGFMRLAEGVVAAGAFAYAGVIRRTVHGVKIAGRHAAVPALSRVLWHVVGLPDRRPWPVTWVPCTRRKLRQRGVDVPRLLAGPGAVALLTRVAERPDQTSLDGAARRRSPRGSFRATGHVPARFALVDDVRTTGATALAAASALQAAGARQILVVTFAVADQAVPGTASSGSSTAAKR